MSKAAMIGIGALALIVAAVIGGLGAGLVGGDGDDDAEETVTVTNAEAGAPAPVDEQPTEATAVIDEDADVNSVDVDDQAIPAGEAKQAEQAVLKIAGGGQLTDLSLSDDPGERYEAEVVRDDGSEIDIALDEKFAEVPNQPYED